MDSQDWPSFFCFAANAVLTGWIFLLLVAPKFKLELRQLHNLKAVLLDTIAGSSASWAQPRSSLAQASYTRMPLSSAL